MPVSTFFQCLHPVARGIALAVLVAGIVHIAVLLARRRRLPPALPLVYALLLLLALWGGSLGYSPLGFGSERMPVLRGFLITKPQRAPVHVASSSTVSLSAAQPMEIEPQLLPGPFRCIWSSSNGGSFDNPTGCDTAYQPGTGASFDFLRVRIRSACGLPPTLGLLRVGVLP
ncbi:MAG: hypothetical protein ACM3MF_10405 [Anaerolineae bacterium]